MKDGIWAMLFIASLFIFLKWIEKIHKGMLDDRQREIDRLAEENHEYRELFSQLLRDKMLDKAKGEKS